MARGRRWGMIGVALVAGAASMDLACSSRSSDAGVMGKTVDAAADHTAATSMASLDGQAETAATGTEVDGPIEQGSVTEPVDDGEAGPSDLTDGGLDADTLDLDGPAGDGASDAEPDVGDADGAPDADGGKDCGSLTATQCLVQMRAGSTCLACALQQCADPSLWCEHLAGETAEAGPAAGQSRQAQCLGALSCIFSTQCNLKGSGVDACYCGLEPRPVCLAAGPAPGATALCRSSEENGLETIDPKVALPHLADTSLGAGTANALILCFRNCGSCP
ncbi:MAG: hypothetical protein M3O36_04455 [Myxococcota bacterium]|nr:hypothetical protein [Myxococcota bacterium]